MSSGVFLAAITPAILAVFSASPLGNAVLRNASIVSGDMRTTPPATAVRCTTSFSPTSTILAAPSLSRCEKVMTNLRFVGFRLQASGFRFWDVAHSVTTLPRNGSAKRGSLTFLFRELGAETLFSPAGRGGDPLRHDRVAVANRF